HPNSRDPLALPSFPTRRSSDLGGVANATAGDPSAAGTLTVHDVDSGENHFQTPASLAGSYGTYTFNPTTGAWSYTLNQALADPRTAGQTAQVHPRGPPVCGPPT